MWLQIPNAILRGRLRLYLIYKILYCLNCLIHHNIHNDLSQSLDYLLQYCQYHSDNQKRTSYHLNLKSNITRLYSQLPTTNSLKYQHPHPQMQNYQHITFDSMIRLYCLTSIFCHNCLHNLQL